MRRAEWEWVPKPFWMVRHRLDSMGMRSRGGYVGELRSDYGLVLGSVREEFTVASTALTLAPAIP